MAARTVENLGSTTPITDAVYGKKQRPKAKPSRTRNPHHTFLVALPAETRQKLAALQGRLEKSTPAKRRRNR